MKKHKWKQFIINNQGEIKYACKYCQEWVDEPEDTECSGEPEYIIWKRKHKKDGYE